MKLSGNTILITGGGSGIGLAFARRFAERGNEVIICGRREDVLAEAKAAIPNLHTRVCDLAFPDARERLCETVIDEFPALNVLVNNAGIQRRLDLTDRNDWQAVVPEIAINLEAPIHLSTLLFQHLASRPSGAIVNVTSGLSFVPLANVPVYCATKAALHSFTLSLRWQLRETPVEVVEVIPPAVDTDLQAPGLHTFGVNVDEFADHVFVELEAGKNEVAYGTAAMGNEIGRERIDAVFRQLNERVLWDQAGGTT